MIDRSLPARFEDVACNVSVGAFIRSLVAEMIGAGQFDVKSRDAAIVLISSFFVPILADEDRIAAWHGLSKASVRRIGQRLRTATIWVGDRASPDCVHEWTETEEEGVSAVSFMCAIMVAKGKFSASRRDDGDLVYGLAAEAPVHYDAKTCLKCGTTKRYVISCTCCECAVRYQKNYKRRSAELRSGSSHSPAQVGA